MNDIPKTATVNVGCVGVFTLYVYKDGYWEIGLKRSDEEMYITTDTDGLERGVMHNPLDGTFCEVEEWMWDCIMDKVGELNLAWVRNALDTPEIKGVTV